MVLFTVYKFINGVVVKSGTPQMSFPDVLIVYGTNGTKTELCYWLPYGDYFMESARVRDFHANS